MVTPIHWEQGAMTSTFGNMKCVAIRVSAIGEPASMIQLPQLMISRKISKSNRLR